MAGHDIRETDNGFAANFEEILEQRRVRETDNGADAYTLQAQRCFRQVKAHTYRTTITIVATALVTFGIGSYTYIRDQVIEQQRDLTTATLAHQKAGHAGYVGTREMDQLHAQMRSSFGAIGTQLDQVMKEFRDHEIRDKVNDARLRTLNIVP